MSVKVGVRVRPYNQRQTDLNCRLCVDMIGNMTRLFDADDPQKHHRDFTFDYSFWSHDQFEVDETGYFVPTGDKYADQQQVFQAVGLEILSNAWEGYHCCLFAYGQTGAGKSYSMVGYGANKGIVPISCEEIFNRISKNDNKNKEYEVNVSMMEIYNEKVQDLLIPISKRPKQGYKIREHKTLGIYVQGMSKHFVDTYESIQKKMEEGSRNRSIAATEMNASSSRAHTIISIQFKQIDIQEGKKRQKLSVIYLVDLAGSEKVGKTGATGDRLKEAAGINKSLSVLGLVISTLADKAMGKGKNSIVPYRDSCLTRILQNALGGNSKTLMICAISPATDNYEETLSTLRYADQAKKIQNKAVVNQSQTDKIIRTLTSEKEELLAKVQKMQEMFKKLSMGLSVSPEMLEQFNDAKEQLRYNNEVMNDYSKTKEEKLMIEKEEQTEYGSKVDIHRPHISNLNEDPQLSRKINYSIDTQCTKIGRRNTDPKNDIEIGGMGIRPLHASIIQDQNHYCIEPACPGDDSNCYLNGNPVTEKTALFNWDRLSFGTNNMFVVLIPDSDPREQIDASKIDWDYAQNELYLKKESLEKELIEEKQKKLKEETDALLRQKEQELAALQKSLLESEALRKTIQIQKDQQKLEIQKKLREEQTQRHEAQRLQKQIERTKKKNLDIQTQQKEKIKQKYHFQKKLLKSLPKCIQINLIAKQFKRNVSMSVKMTLTDGEDEQGYMDMKKRSILVKVVNREVGYTYWWDTQKLSNRYYIIKDMSEQYFETGVIPVLTENNDPFWDPPEHTLIGRGFLTTKALAYMFDNPGTLPIIGEDEHCGEMVVNMIPTDQTGTKNLCEVAEDEEVEFEPEDLLDKPFYFLIIIESAKIPANYEKVFIEYSIKIDQYKTETFKTEEIAERTMTPEFNYRRLHNFPNVTEMLLKYLTTAKLIFKVYGCEMIPEQKKETIKSITPKKTEGLEPDVVKAKKQDENKLKTEGKAQTKSTPSQITKKKESKANSVAASAQKQATPSNTGGSQNKAQGSKVNNKINDRNQNDKKEKDCQIY